MKEIGCNYQIVFPTPQQSELLQQASGLISFYAKKGIMLEQPIEKLAELATTTSLILAVHNHAVIGSAAITFIYPDGTQEFGAWAIKSEFVKHGIGKHLFVELLKTKGLPSSLIALGNNNSAPILYKFGALPLEESKVHPAVFEPCLTCNCDKSHMSVGRKCVDTIFDLLPIASKLTEE